MCVPEAGSACDPVLGRVVWCLRCTHGTPHNTHTHTHTTHTRARARARAHTHTHRSRVRTCAHPAAHGGLCFFFRGRHLGLQTCSSACGDALQRLSLLGGCSPRNRTLLQACNVRAPVSLRGPFRGKSFETLADTFHGSYAPFFTLTHTFHGSYAPFFTLAHTFHGSYAPFFTLTHTFHGSYTPFFTLAHTFHGSYAPL